MNPMAILGIALGIGAVVYALSLLAGDETLILHPVRPSDPAARPDLGFEEPVQAPAVDGSPGEGSAPPEDVSAEIGTTYVPLTTARVSWQRRVSGVVGLVALVAVGAAVLAGGIYQAGHVVNQTISKFLGQ
jgi:hypothetical protein